MPLSKFFALFIPAFFLTMVLQSQMITGHWKGKINRQKVEVKIIQNGDKLTGTSYYYESPSHYRRYSIRGYFDPNTNSAVWWDDHLLEEKSGRFNISTPGKIPMLSRADFNCPGDGTMMLDGTAAKKEDETNPTGDVKLDKTTNHQFNDEWDDIIDNYLVGANDPDLISEIENSRPRVEPATEEPEEEVQDPVKPVVTQPKVSNNPIREPKKETIAIPADLPKQSIKEKYVSREKKLVKEIPLSGDSIELRFYDNAEIDGDSISLFLNDQLFREHIKLTGSAYSIMLATSDLKDSNELIMVAENLGSIPPNTSYMVAIVNGQRYDAYLASTEGSSAMIRFVKQLEVRSEK